ncbi:MAG: hypothetical protein M1818_000650 [Claussenomyces sp. TS43310]|nr:MAG: hypothetical protein M1818_000650 [Claussenomyces sp. TS43310]
MAEVHRKIELQEQDDLRFLVNNVRRAANDKIDLALPPIEGEDALRRRVEELVHEYITQTFTTASANITINGHPTPPTLLDALLTSSSTDAATDEAEYEPLDHKLSARATKLLQEEADLLLEIASLKRQAPREAAEKQREAYRRAIEEEEALMREAEERAAAKDAEGVRFDLPALERHDEVEKSWARAVEGLASLEREMGGTAAKMERAKRAGEYALTER